MALHVVFMPISVMLNQFEQMGVDEERVKKRVQWQGEVEQTATKRLDELLNQGFRIVDVQKVTVQSYEWLRYTLHKVDGGEQDAVHAPVRETTG